MHRVVSLGIVSLRLVAERVAAHHVDFVVSRGRSRSCWTVYDIQGFKVDFLAPNFGVCVVIWVVDCHIFVKLVTRVKNRLDLGRVGRGGDVFARARLQRLDLHGREVEGTRVLVVAEAGGVGVLLRRAVLLRQQVPLQQRTRANFLPILV